MKKDSMSYEIIKTSDLVIFQNGVTK